MAVPTLTANSPSSGDIAWTAFHIQYNGHSYAVNAGSTASVYVYWLYNGGSPSATLSTSNTQPTLTADDLLLFINKNGIPVNVQFASLVDGSLIVDGSILAASIAAGTIEGTNIAAGTIEGTNIAAGTITSSLIAANAITAGLIDAGAIDGMDINGVTITGSLIEATSGGVLVYKPGGTVLNANPDFTTGIADWTATSGAISYAPPTYTPAGGSAHDTMLLAVSHANPAPLVYSGEVESESEPVTAGDSYFVDFIIQSSGLQGAEAEARLSVLWSNNTETQVASLAGNIGTWTEYTAIVTAPAGVTTMKLDVVGFSSNSGGSVSVARAAITSQPQLIASIAPAAGTDSYGDAYPEGIKVQESPSGAYILLDPSTGELTVQSSLAGFQAVCDGGSLSMATPSSAASPATYAVQDSPLASIIQSPSNGYGAAEVKLYAGTVSVGPYLTVPPLVALNPAQTDAETWHPLVLAYPWTTVAGYAAPQYRLLPDGNVQLAGIADYGSTSTGQVAINSGNPLPAAYWPSSKKYLRMGGGDRATIMIDTSGNVNAVDDGDSWRYAEIDGIYSLL